MDAMTTPAPLLLTRKAAADSLGVSERYIDILRNRGDLDAVKVGTRTRITAESLTRYVRSLPAA